MADQPTTRPRISCLSVVVSVLLAIGIVLLARSGSFNQEPLPWPATAGAVIVAVAVFWIERRLLGFFWGVAAALLMTVHPCLRQPDSDGWSRFFAEAGIAAVMAGTAAGWNATFLPRTAWRVWPFLILGIGLSIGLGWAGERRAGIFAAVVAAAGLGTASVLSWVFRGRKLPQGPTFLNTNLALLSAGAAPALGLLVFRLIDSSTITEGSFWAPVLQAQELTTEPLAKGLTVGQLNRWFWPWVWLTGPVLIWGLWRALRNGWRHWRRDEPPLCWMLPLYALLTLPTLFFWPMREPDRTPLVVSAVVVLVTVYLVADVLRTTVKKLVLPPGYERELEQVSGGTP